jgi:hypothetical protein
VAFALDDIKDWREGISCTPTTLAAITGKTPEIVVLLRGAAKVYGRETHNMLLFKFWQDGNH